MRDSVRLGRLGGIPIGAHWSVIAVIGYVGLGLALVAIPAWFPSADRTDRIVIAALGTLGFLLSILFHEFGHAVAARRHDMDVDGVTLWFLGGVARFRSQAPTPRAEFQVGAAGPAASFATAAVFGIVAQIIAVTTSWTIGAAMFGWLAIANIVIGATNLFPVAPLDGGRVVTAAVWSRTGRAEWSRLVLARIGLVSGIGLALAAAALWWTGRIDVFMGVIGVGTGLFLIHSTLGEIAGAVIREQMATTTAGELMARHPRSFPESTSVAEFCAWAEREGGPGAFPVTRWGPEPVGYVVAGVLRRMPEPEQAWHTLGQVAVGIDDVARAWSDESIGDLLERLPDDQHTAVVVHDPITSLPIGTLTRPLLDPVFRSPDRWGRSRSTPPPPRAADPVHAGVGPGVA